MVDILQATFSGAFFVENVRILIVIPQEVVSEGLIDKKLALVEIMARWQTRDEPLSEPMMTQFTDTIWCNKVTVNPNHVQMH